jgi:hypothetical protein
MVNRNITAITANNTSFAPEKNGNLGGGKYITFPEDILQNDSE